MTQSDDFPNAISQNREQIGRAAGDSGITFEPDALEVLNGALIKPGTEEFGLSGEQLYSAAKTAIARIQQEYPAATFGLDEIAAAYWRSPPPWGKA